MNTPINENLLTDLKLKIIGYVETSETTIPRHWSVSSTEGKLVIDEKYSRGLIGLNEGKHIQVVFFFHKSQSFSANLLIQVPPHSGIEKGVFCTCSPIRPNPIGISVVKVLKVEGNIVFVKGLDMLNGTPILDIKPHTELQSGI